MKTSKLIKALQEADPNDEYDVSVGNTDIFFVEKEIAYWDGSQEILIRDESSPYYNIKGARYKSSGYKVVINTLSIGDALMNDSEMEVDLSDLPEQRRIRYGEYIEELRKENDDIKKSVDRSQFIRWIQKKLGFSELTINQDNAARKAYDDLGLSWRDSEGFSSIGSSIADKCEVYWDSIIEISDDGLNYKRKDVNENR